jgi:hypothetical protein
MTPDHFQVFKKAQAFARDSWLTVAPMDLTDDDRNKELSELVTMMGGETVHQKILRKVKPADQVTVEDLLTDVEIAAREAGYAYGLAVGLLLGSGGAR